MRSKNAPVKLDWSCLLGFDQIAVDQKARRPGTTDLAKIGPKVGIGGKDSPRAAAPASVASSVSASPGANRAGVYSAPGGAFAKPPPDAASRLKMRASPTTNALAPMRSAIYSAVFAKQDAQPSHAPKA